MVFSLLRLPVTVIEDIVKLLCPHCHVATESSHGGGPCNMACPAIYESERRSALASLCKANKLINNIATPYLYHYPQFSNDGLIRFMRTIFETRPELVRHVKSLHDQNWAFSLESTQEDVAFLDDVVAESDAATEEGFDSTPDIVALLLGQCLDVEEVCLSAGYADVDAFSSLSYRSLPRLRKLIASHRDTEFGFGAQELESLFAAAPKLVSFHAWSLTGVGTDLDISNLRELKIFNSELEIDDFSLLLKQCPRLKSLTYESGGACVSDLESPSAREMQDVILQRASGLGFLSMNLSEAMWHGELGDDSMMRSLKALDRLEELTLDAKCLVGQGRPDGNVYVLPEQHTQFVAVEGHVLVELLPSSLRSLTIITKYVGIYDYVQSLLPAITSLGRMCRDEFPHLNAVAFPGLSEDNAEAIRPLFEANNVSFSISY